MFAFITEPGLKCAARKVVIFTQHIVCKPILCFCFVKGEDIKHFQGCWDNYQMIVEERTVTAGARASFGLLVSLLRGGMNPGSSSADDILWCISSHLYLQTPGTCEC